MENGCVLKWVWRLRVDFGDVAWRVISGVFPRRGCFEKVVFLRVMVLKWWCFKGWWF